MTERLCRDDTTKPDGRYLIYYSWPEQAPADESAADEKPPADDPDV